MDISTLNAHFDKLKQLAKTTELLDGLKAADADSGGLFAAEIDDLTVQIEREQATVNESEGSISAWISGIEDNMTRMIFRLRFLRGLQWCEVAGYIGKACTEDCVKSAAYRYLSAERRSAARRSGA